MPQPTAGDVHVNVPLTNISVAYVQSASAFVADKVFANIPVQKQSDRYFTYDKRYWQRTEATRRAPGAQSAGSGFQINSTPTYFADVWAVHKDVADQVRSNTDRPLDADRDATNWVTQQMMLAKEKEFARSFLTTGVWATETDLSAGTKWDANGSDPIGQVAYLSEQFLRTTGFRPNAAVMSPGTERTLKNHSLVLDRIKYTQRGIVTNDLLASLFDLQNMYTMQAVEYGLEEPAVGGYDPSNVATAQTINSNMSFIGEDPNGNSGKGFMLLLYVPPAPSILTPAAGYTFSWTGYMGASALGGRIKRFRLEENASDRIEMEMAFDMKVVCADMGSIITNVHA
ncbi:hypothetical protein UFOVP1246_72 [uncultured Caudovirales phage]|uniref:Major capsid protein GpE n=1 Tax=uncultured Caudovirales phage TaxID=2100421 RepID=A0A6J5RM83_9CAUD|nr:hypothetical protein UFOVP1246_72 [uncultured Caudovirales phage]